MYTSIMNAMNNFKQSEMLGNTQILVCCGIVIVVIAVFGFHKYTVLTTASMLHFLLRPQECCRQASFQVRWGADTHPPREVTGYGYRCVNVKVCEEEGEAEPPLPLRKGFCAGGLKIGVEDQVYKWGVETICFGCERVEKQNASETGAPKRVRAPGREIMYMAIAYASKWLEK